MQVCHHCDVRSCVNPTHLFLGTIAANMADKTAKGRQARGEGHGQAKLTDGQILEIRAAEGPQRAISARYGVSQPLIGKIQRRELWKHL
jgi:hypothetical protein